MKYNTKTLEGKMDKAITAYENNLADVFSLIQNVMGSFRLLNRKYGVDRGLHKSCLDLRIHVSNNAGKNFRLYRRRAGTQRASNNSHVSDVDIFKVDLGFCACKRSYHYPSCTMCEIMDALAHNLSTKTVYGNINAISRLKLLFQNL